MKKNVLYVLTGLIILVIIGLVISLIFINKDDNTENDTVKTIKVSEVTHSIFYTPFYVAIENGYFKEEGIDIDLLLVSGSDNVAASVLSNDTEVGLAGPESAVYVYLGKEKDYLQVFAGLTKRDGQFMLSRSSKEFDWHDLIGKEILIGRKTGMPGLSFLRALKNQGINPDDVNINESIEFAEISGAFIGGEGDYVNLFEPLASKLVDNNNGYIVTSVGAASDAFPYTAFYARKSYINDNKDLLIKFSKALKKGIDFTFNNDGNTIAESIQNQFSDTSIEDLSVMIERYKESDAWLTTPFVEEDFYNTLINLLEENGLINETVYYKDMVNNMYE